MVLKEPSVVAFDRDTNKIKAIGEEARLMLGRTPGNIVAVHPMKNGIISDYMVTDMSIGEMGNVANMILNSEDKGELSIKGTNAVAKDDGYNEFTMDETSRGDVAMELFFNKVEK